MRVWMVDAVASGEKGPIKMVQADIKATFGMASEPLEILSINWGTTWDEGDMVGDPPLYGIVHAGGADACEKWVERNEERIKHLRERML